MGKHITPDAEHLNNYDVQPNGCWHWKGYINPGGYGSFFQRRDGKGKTWLVHRFVYGKLVGPLEGRKPIDHVCHNVDESCKDSDACLHRRCINPDHLQLVTSRINVLRGNGVAAENASKTHCHEGHAFTTANTYFEPSGGRQCITCRKLNYKKYYDSDAGGEAARERARVRMRELRKDPAYREYKNARERERYIRRQREKGKTVTARPNDRITYAEYKEAAA